jgi:hypothetical protein
MKSYNRLFESIETKNLKPINSWEHIQEIDFVFANNENRDKFQLMLDTFMNLLVEEKKILVDSDFVILFNRAILKVDSIETDSVEDINYSKVTATTIDPPYETTGMEYKINIKFTGEQLQFIQYFLKASNYIVNKQSIDEMLSVIIGYLMEEKLYGVLKKEINFDQYNDINLSEVNFFGRVCTKDKWITSPHKEESMLLTLSCS